MTCFGTMAIFAAIVSAGWYIHEGPSLAAGSCAMLGCCALFMDAHIRNWR